MVMHKMMLNVPEKHTKTLIEHLFLNGWFVHNLLFSHLFSKHFEFHKQIVFNERWFKFLTIGKTFPETDGFDCCKAFPFFMRNTACAC